jgi:hypothetical protein
MESSAERKADRVSDPNYPSFEVLPGIADKLLTSRNDETRQGICESWKRDRAGGQSATARWMGPFFRSTDFPQTGRSRPALISESTRSATITCVRGKRLGLGESLRLIRESAEQSRV